MTDTQTLDMIARLVASGIGRENGVTVREVREIPGVEVDDVPEMVSETPAFSTTGDPSDPETVVYLSHNGVLAAILAYINDD